jgi:hypothetical protein
MKTKYVAIYKLYIQGKYLGQILCEPNYVGCLKNIPTTGISTVLVKGWKMLVD